MGQEINAYHFQERDFDDFTDHLRDETELLAQWFSEGCFDDSPPVAGFELEAWLVDEELRPAPVNHAFLATMAEEMGADSMVSPELASFNVEFNVEPARLKANALSVLASELTSIWQRGREAAQGLNTDLAMIGILPTLDDSDLVMANLSAMNRYVALNAEILRLRGGRPMKLDIHGHDILRTEHRDVMLESATTSFQLHLQIPVARAVRAYNASIIASAPLVAVSANSPYLFGKDLWAETRIPVFEQAVEVGGFDAGSHGPMRRVTFGSGYVRHSVMECFRENLEHFPVLLPVHFDSAPEKLAHLRLHNGTLWRWNRPLIGFTGGNNDSKPHLRIEQRVVPAGPTIEDAVANAALYYGLNQALCDLAQAPEDSLTFPQARDNFYACAQHGLDAHLLWLDGQKYPARNLLLKHILPLAHVGLTSLNIAHQEADHYLGIIESRVQNGRNGAAWQRTFVAKHGADMKALLKAYLERQHSGIPVHQWDI